jgi:hypothetical protein
MTERQRTALAAMLSTKMAPSLVERTPESRPMAGLSLTPV